MENKNIIIIVAAVVAVIAIVGVIFATGILNGNDSAPTETTKFKSDFMEGSFVGKVALKDDQKFMQSYEDEKNKITYNISTVDDSDALMDVYYLQGVMNPEHRTINGNDWNIYFTQAVESNQTQTADNTMNIIICQSQGEKQGYLIYSIIDAKSPVNGTTIYGEAYTNYIEPLLKSLTLKESSNVPKINEEFGLSESEFAQQMDLVQQVKAGNTSVLEESG